MLAGHAAPAVHAVPVVQAAPHVHAAPAVHAVPAVRAVHADATAMRTAADVAVANPGAAGVMTHTMADVAFGKMADGAIGEAQEPQQKTSAMHAPQLRSSMVP